MHLQQCMPALAWHMGHWVRPLDAHFCILWNNKKCGLRPVDYYFIGTMFSKSLSNPSTVTDLLWSYPRLYWRVIWIGTAIWIGTTAIWIGTAIHDLVVVVTVLLTGMAWGSKKVSDVDCCYFWFFLLGLKSWLRIVKKIWTSCNLHRPKGWIPQAITFKREPLKLSGTESQRLILQK